MGGVAEELYEECGERGACTIEGAHGYGGVCWLFTSQAPALWNRILLPSFLSTANFHLPSVPLYFISTLEGETDIFDRLPLPYDPHASASQTPSSIYDWQHNPPVPPPIRVVASPEEYESSSAPEDVQNFVIPPDGHPKEVVRLKEEVARAVGLKSGWAVAVPVGEDGVVSGFISNSSGLWRHDNA